jgi:hypothetical protein
MLNEKYVLLPSYAGGKFLLRRWQLSKNCWHGLCLPYKTPGCSCYGTLFPRVNEKLKGHQLVPLEQCFRNILFSLMRWDWVHLVLWALSCLFHQPQLKDDRWAIGAMQIRRRNRSTRRKPTLLPHCPPQVPHNLTRARTPGRRSNKPSYCPALQGPSSRFHYIHRRESCGFWKMVTFHSENRLRMTVFTRLLEELFLHIMKFIWKGSIQKEATQILWKC